SGGCPSAAVEPLSGVADIDRGPGGCCRPSAATTSDTADCGSIDAAQLPPHRDAPGSARHCQRPPGSGGTDYQPALRRGRFTPGGRRSLAVGSGAEPVSAGPADPLHAYNIG